MGLIESTSPECALIFQISTQSDLLQHFPSLWPHASFLALQIWIVHSAYQNYPPPYHYIPAYHVVPSKSIIWNWTNIWPSLFFSPNVIPLCGVPIGFLIGHLRQYREAMYLPKGVRILRMIVSITIMSQTVTNSAHASRRMSSNGPSDLKGAYYA